MNCTGVDWVGLVEHIFGISVQEIHSKMNTLEIPPFDRQISRFGGTTAQYNSVEGSQ